MLYQSGWVARKKGVTPISERLRHPPEEIGQLIQGSVKQRKNALAALVALIKR
jgi:hypothetical protein